MARYVGPKSRLCRREGMHLFLKGMKCHTGKCTANKRTSPPGQHGQRRTKHSDYAIQLREKQKVKRIYGLLERQFRRYFKEAQKSERATGEVLLEHLERRLDNVLYRMGFATSRPEARQIVRHRAMVVNGQRVDIPSYAVSVGDVIQIGTNRKGQTKRIRENMERTKLRPVPAWVQVEADSLKGVIVRAPLRDDIGMDIQEQLIVELYSK